MKCIFCDSTTTILYEENGYNGIWLCQEHMKERKTLEQITRLHSKRAKSKKHKAAMRRRNGTNKR